MRWNNNVSWIVFGSAPTQVWACYELVWAEGDQRHHGRIGDVRRIEMEADGRCMTQETVVTHAYGCDREQGCSQK